MEDNRVFINGQWVKKPTRGKCAYCGSDLLEFYDDGTGICLNCGRTFSWLKPLPGPVSQGHRTAPQTSSRPQKQHTAYVTQSSGPLEPKRTPGRPPAPPEPVSEHVGVPEGPGFLSPRAVSILAFIGALLLGVGAIITILAIPMGSWPKSSDYELIGNLRKIGMIIWASGTMIFLMAGFAAAGTREMSYRVRATLIASSVALAILSFSFWLGMAIMTGGMFGP